MTDKELNILEEIMDFIRENKIYLYLEIRDYALENKPEWLDILRKKNIRRHLIAYTNSKRRVDKVKENCFIKYCNKRIENKASKLQNSGSSNNSE